MSDPYDEKTYGMMALQEQNRILEEGRIKNETRIKALEGGITKLINHLSEKKVNYDNYATLALNDSHVQGYYQGRRDAYGYIRDKLEEV